MHATRWPMGWVLVFALGCSKGADLEIPADSCAWADGTDFQRKLKSLELDETSKAHARGWLARKMFTDPYTGGTSVAEAVAEARQQGWVMTTSDAKDPNYAKELQKVTGLGVTDLLLLAPKCGDSAKSADEAQ